MHRPSLSDSPRLFENPILDRLSRVHHLVPLYGYAPVIVALLWRSRAVAPPAVAITLFFAGYITWTLVEYFGHRFLFHWEVRGPIGRRIHFLIHGVHHDFPNDPLRLVMPLLMSLPIMLAAFAVLRVLVGPSFDLPMLAGFIAGYLAYDMLHFHVHHGKPRTLLGRALRQRHLLHHFSDHTASFGVSAPWWDAVFGTRPGRPSRRLS